MLLFEELLDIDGATYLRRARHLEGVLQFVREDGNQARIGGAAPDGNAQVTVVTPGGHVKHEESPEPPAHFRAGDVNDHVRRVQVPDNAFEGRGQGNPFRQEIAYRGFVGPNL